MAPAGIEPTTFRFVAEHLNHCATAVPMDHRSMYYLNHSIRFGLVCYLSVVLKKVAIPEDALRYRPEGRGFDSEWYHWNLSLKILPGAPWLWGRLSL